MKTNLSVFWTKLQLKLIKILPIVISVVYVLNVVLSLFGITTMILPLIGGMSLLPLMFLYTASYAFRFCEYHRMFIHYIAVNDLLNWINYIHPISVSDLAYCSILLILYGITCFISLCMFIRQKKN